MSSEVIMGRADILFNFLELIGKNQPSDLDPYLKNIDTEDDKRPVVDQIVDVIVSGNQDLYSAYAKARELAGPRNPYSSVIRSPASNEYRESLGIFMSNWILLEQRLREMRGDNLNPGHPTSINIKDLQFRLNETMFFEFKNIRRLRNEVVHGIDKSTSERLIEAANAIQIMLEQLEQVPADDS